MKPVRLKALRIQFEIIDFLSNFRCFHRVVLNKKIHLGVAIISLSMMNNSCSSDKKNSVDKTPDKKDSITKKPVTDSLVKNKGLKNGSSIQKINNKHKVIFSPNSRNKKESLITVTSCYINFENGIDQPEGEVQSETDSTIYTVTDLAPEFIGGTDSLLSYINKNIKYFPAYCYVSIEGTVYIRFVVTKTGELADIKVIRGIGTAQDEEAIRLVKSMPNWIPGKHRGKTVNTYFILPIHFNLQ